MSRYIGNLYPKIKNLTDYLFFLLPNLRTEGLLEGRVGVPSRRPPRAPPRCRASDKETTSLEVVRRPLTPLSQDNGQGSQKLGSQLRYKLEQCFGIPFT